MKKSIRLLMGFLVPAFMLAGIVASPAIGQQTAADIQKQLVGSWKLVSDSNTNKDGVTKAGAAFGPNPNGRLVFMSNGQYMNVNTRPGIPKFASGNRMQGTADENKAVVHGTIAHFGTFSISPDGKVLIMKIEGSTWPSWVGTEQKRNLTLTGDDLKYSVPASIGGTSELTYKRMK